MPRSKTVIKRHRQDERRRVRNKAGRSELKTLERGVRSAPDAAGAAANLRDLQSDLDKAAARGIIHRNKAARKKSRLTKAATKTATKPA